MQSLINRQAYIECVWNELDAYFVAKECPVLKLHLGQIGNYKLVKYLVEKKTIPIKEWEQISSIMSLNFDPLYQIAKVIDDNVVLDYDKLLTLTPESMYSWMYAPVCLVIDEIQRGD